MPQDNICPPQCLTAPASCTAKDTGGPGAWAGGSLGGDKAALLI